MRRYGTWRMREVPCQAPAKPLPHGRWDETSLSTIRRSGPSTIAEDAHCLHWTRTAKGPPNRRNRGRRVGEIFGPTDVFDRVALFEKPTDWSGFA